MTEILVKGIITQKFNNGVFGDGPTQYVVELEDGGNAFLTPSDIVQKPRNADAAEREPAQWDKVEGYIDANRPRFTLGWSKNPLVMTRAKFSA